MKTINFSDQELESMLMMYYDELAEAKQYVEQIQEIIKKLSGKPENEPVKRGRKPQAAKPEVAPAKAVPATLKKQKKKAGPKPKVKAVKAKADVEKPIAKPVAEKKPLAKQPATVKSVVGSLLAAAPKKDVKPAVKNKSTEKKRLQEMAASAKLSKPVAKKQAGKVRPTAVKVVPADENIATKE